MKSFFSPLCFKIFKTCPRTGRIIGLQKNGFAKLMFPLFGLFSLLWLLLRLLPKPSRATYPCMKIAMPVASTFILWLAGFTGSFFVYKKARMKFRQSKYVIGILLISAAAVVFTLSLLPTTNTAYSDVVVDVEDPYGPNNPVGEPKGIFPGRVVWAWNPDATNENCDPDVWTDGYFLDKNCNQAVVDAMLSNALLTLTEADNESAAWDKIFRYFNNRRGKGDVGYAEGEKIFIKINAVHAWSTKNDGSIIRDGSYGNVDTSPQAVLAMLRQLVFNAGVPQENIYIGDPLTHIFTHCLEKWRTDFPNIHYMDKSGIDGREKYSASSDYAMQFSDKGAVLSEHQDKYFKEMEDAEYLLDIPAMKGHEWAGVTFFGKNFFGAHTRSGAGHMHPGLHYNGGYAEPIRGQYGMYRVFVDLLGHQDLGGKILLYFMDGLWATSEEHEPPVKFQMAPFHNDWTNSIFLSLDPLAIESVCLDILQAEFPKEQKEKEYGKNWFPNYPAVDDYLHQAADSQNWPEGIIYDPEGDGTPIGSLGVHEHWNNPVDQLYSRNLGSADGIELIKNFTTTDVTQMSFQKPASFKLLQNYPNPFNPSTEIRYNMKNPAFVNLTVFNSAGQMVKTLVAEEQAQGIHAVHWSGLDDSEQAVASGLYFYMIQVDDGQQHFNDTKRMIVLR